VIVLSKLLLESVEERRDKIENRFSVWSRDTVARHFEKVSKTYTEKPFLYINGEEHRYGDIWDRAVDYAKSFIQLGVKRRDHIAILMENDASFPSFMIAASMVGAVFIPINSMLTKEEVEYILTQSDTKYLILQEKVKDKQHGQAVKELLSTPSFREHSNLEKVISFDAKEKELMDEHFLTWETFLNGAEAVSDSELNARWEQSRYPDEVAIIMYTSGSTGSPKGVMLTDDMLLRCAYGTVLSRAIEEGRVTFAPLPFYHCFAIVEAILAMSFVGGSVISALGASPLKSLELMEKYKQMIISACRPPSCPY